MFFNVPLSNVIESPTKMCYFKSRKTQTDKPNRLFGTSVCLSVSTVPHLKALISGKFETRGLRCGRIYVLCHALLSKAILLHTEGLQMNITVFIHCKYLLSSYRQTAVVRFPGTRTYSTFLVTSYPHKSWALVGLSPRAWYHF